MLREVAEVLDVERRQWEFVGQVLATSLFGDLAAGLYEEASARLREHLSRITVVGT